MGAFGPFRSMKPEDVRFSKELRDHGRRVMHTVREVLQYWYVIIVCYDVYMPVYRVLVLIFYHYPESYI